jgi:hypothetical protein
MNTDERKWLHVKPGLVPCNKHVKETGNRTKQSKHLTPPTSPHWLVTNYKKGAWVGVCMTRPDIVSYSVPS